MLRTTYGMFLGKPATPAATPKQEAQPEKKSTKGDGQPVQDNGQQPLLDFDEDLLF